jgi:lipid-A-disaccharide synthase-like uncharacterized protein
MIKGMLLGGSLYYLVVFISFKDTIGISMAAMAVVLSTINMMLGEK